MEMIDPTRLAERLRTFTGAAYIHAEVTPGGFTRNIAVRIEETFVHGDGPYRVTLRLPDRGWIRIEGLTHAVLEDEAGRLLIAGHDETGRLTTALELSREPFE
jgi:hypothetical protein